MPDLTSSPLSGGAVGGTLGSNYRRVEQKFSNYGTRRLRFYTIEIDGYDILEIENDTNEYDWNFETTGPHGDDAYYGYKNQPKSIIEAILRGVSLVAETYYVSWWGTDYDGQYPYLYITVAIAGDTYLDGLNQYLQKNTNAYSLQNAIADALGTDYAWDNVYVWAREIVGHNLNYASDGPPVALGREKVQLTEEQKAAKVALRARPDIAKVSRQG